MHVYLKKKIKYKKREKSFDWNVSKILQSLYNLYNILHDY